MSLIEVNGQKGNLNLDRKFLGDVKNVLKVPEGAYFVFDVEDGKERLETEPSISEKNIFMEHRSPLTLFEGIILGIVFPEIFNDHNIDLCGSRLMKYLTPKLSVSDGRLGLRICYEKNGLRWGIPSCGSREILKH
jgi:hypothetical protein